MRWLGHSTATSTGIAVCKYRTINTTRGVCHSTIDCVSATRLLTLGSPSGTVLAFFHIDEWAAITTAVTTMVTAWSVFHRTKDKLARYTNTIEKTQSVLMWWNALCVNGMY
jgi:hypothetical protein